MKDFVHALGLLCLLLVRPSHAFIDPPWITPEHPQAGETIYVNLRSGVCDVITIAPIPPEITQDGSAVRILVWSGHYTDPIQCIYPTESGAIAIGSFPPGSYTLQVDRWYQIYGMARRLRRWGLFPSRSRTVQCRRQRRRRSTFSVWPHWLPSWHGSLTSACATRVGVQPIPA